MAYGIPDEDIRIRMVDRVVDEARQRVDEAKADMREAGFRRVKDSPLLRVLQVVPGVGEPIGKLMDVGEAMLRQPVFESEPLAYLAFASETFTSRPVIARAGGRRALAQVLEESLADRPGYVEYDPAEEDDDDL